MNRSAADLAVLALLAALAGPPRAAGEEAGPGEGPGALLVTDASWKAADRPAAGWERPEHDDSAWLPAASGWGTPESAYPHACASNLFGYPSRASWIWAEGEGRERAFFRRRFRVPEGASRAELVAVGDDDLRIFLNGVSLGDSGSNSAVWGWRGCARAFDALPWLAPGDNVIALAAADRGGCRGVLLELRIDAEPLREVLKRSPRSLDPHPASAPDHRPLWSFPILALDGMRKHLDEAEGRNRRLLAVLWTLRRRLDADRREVADLLSSRIRGGGPAAVDAADLAGLLDVGEAVPAVEALLGRSGDDRTRLAAASALLRLGSARHVPALGELLRGLRSGAVDDAEVDRHVARLGADDWRERQEACDALRRLGRPALPRLRAALGRDDPEVVARARLLIRFVEEAGDETDLRPLLLRTLERGIRMLGAREEPERRGGGR
ncbi:MAG: hypothetical protein MUC63_09510 [Planctomycetes bacterium]|nr:hypothetical protein [Planctomycetota bacterium]